MNSKLFLAGVFTFVVYLVVNRFTRFVSKDFNTQAFVDPSSVPGVTPSDADANPQQYNDDLTTQLTMGVMLPQAQLASGYGAELTPNPLNPVLPPGTYGNTMLDSPIATYIPPRSPAN